ncbi:MAG: hypothetical protein QXL01_06630 [Thermoplasmatales archaeon]
MTDLNFLIALDLLNKLTVVNREYSLESGFFWVEFENGKSLQCCLNAVLDNDGALIKYTPHVSIYDNGYYEGLSRDNNQWAACENGEANHIEEFLIEQARQCGLKIVV